MEIQTIKFKATFGKSYAQIIPAVVFIPMCIAILIFLPYIIQKKIAEGQMDLKQWLGSILGFFGTVAGLYSFYIFAKGFWIFSYFVELKQDKIIGKNLWRQTKEIFYSNISSMKKHKIYNNIVIKDNNGITIIITAGIDHYAKCIEMIRERAVNVKEVDYGGLDKKPHIWKKNN